jgi:hypothetical protein
MKKLYFLAVSLLIGGASIAQTVLTNHFSWALTDPANPQIAVYSWGTGGADGFVSGNNTYGDLASVQLFNSATGVTGAGTVSKAYVWIPIKNDAGGSINVNVYANNAGAVGAVLGTQTVTIASIDTTQAGLGVILDGAAVTGLYNVEVTFATPVAFPAGGFWLGYTFGTGANVIAGGTTTINAAAYTLADTHSGVLDATGAFDNYGQYDVDVAHAVFPEVTFTANLSTEAIAAKVYPNPAADVLNISVAEPMASIELVGVDGRVVLSTAASGFDTTLDVSALRPGVYYYTITTEKGNVARNSFVKK